MSLNQCNFIGILGRDPEVKVSSSGKKVVKACIAVSEKYTNSRSEKVDTTEWVNLVAFDNGKGAGIASTFEKHLCKGAKIFVSCKMTSNSYEGKDGIKKVFTEFVVQSFDFAGGKKKEDGSGYDASPTSAGDGKVFAGNQDFGGEDDLPF